jgi:AraC family transcriptional regulator, ethanolamine operon transcriptional activator
MPAQTFLTLEAFMDANRHATLRSMLLGRDRGHWALTHLTLGNMSVQWGQASGKAVVEGATRPGGVSVFLQTQGTSAFSGNGHRFDALSTMIVGPGKEFCLAADGPSRRWCSIFIPNRDFFSTDETPEHAPALMRNVFQLSPQRMERFRSAMEQLDQAVAQAPAAFDSVAAQRAAKEKLLREVCIVFAGPVEAGRAIGRHVVSREQIVRMSMRFVDEHDGEYLDVEQLAVAAGVSERTLRDAFQDYFGLAPVGYLNKRTLHRFRSALKAADPKRATVTEIATRLGAWQFGRLARDYRMLFGELPSETLRRLN